MDKFNGVFKSLAEKMHLPAFFKGNTLLFNNLFLAIVAVVVLIALILVIFLVPGKKKKKAAAEKVSAPTAAASEETPAPEEKAAAPVEAEPVAEEAPAAEPEKVAVVEAEAAPAVVEDEPAPAEEPAEETSAPEAKEEAPAAEPEKEEVASEEVVAEKEPAAEKKTKEEKKPVAKKPVAEKASAEAAGKIGGKYEIVKRYGSFYFLLKANNGQLLLESNGYTTEAGAKGGIDTFKNAVENGEFRIDPDKNGNFRFVLRASARSQVVYHGESYSTRQSAEGAVGSVKNFALRAVVKRVEEADVEDGVLTQLAPLKESEHKTGGKYEIVESDGQFAFLLKANNGQLLLESPEFTTEAGAKAGIETFKKATESGVYSIDETKNGKFRFILRSGAQVRYFGEQYPTRQSAEGSIRSVCSFAQKAVLK